MRIVVCVKQVPEASHLAFDPVSGRLIREGIPLVLNTFDRRAALAAVQLRERHGGEVVVLTMGPPSAEAVVRECLALGADRAVLLSDPALAGSDTLATARTLARAIKRIGFDLILCGRHSVDGETGQVGPQIAALLDLPHISAARALVLDGARLIVERDTDTGAATLETSLPALVTASEQLVKPVPPSAEALAAAAIAPVERLGIFDLGGALGEYGAAGSPTEVLAVRQLPSKRERALRTTSAPTVAAAALRNYLEWIPVRPAAGDPAPPVRAPSGAAFWALLGTEDADPRPAGELIRAAGEMAGAAGGHVVAVAIGHQPGDLGSLGADQVLAIETGAVLHAEPAAAALALAISDRRPAALVGSTGFLGRDILPRTAALLGLGMTADCIGLHHGPDGRVQGLKPAHGGRFVAPIAMRTEPAIVTLRPGVYLPTSTATTVRRSSASRPNHYRLRGPV
ncbi:MAG: hypothetical protein U0556_01010 [Dehalococcoidia bacterium]